MTKARVRPHVLSGSSRVSCRGTDPVLRLRRVAERDAIQPGADLFRADLADDVRRFALSLTVVGALAALAALIEGAGLTALTVGRSLRFVPLVLSALGYAWARRDVERDPATWRWAAALIVGGAAIAVGIDDILTLDPVGTSSPPSWICAVLLTYAVWIPAPRVHHAVAAGLAAIYLIIGATAAHAFGLYPQATTGSVVVSAVAGAASTWVSGMLALMIAERRRSDRARYENALQSLETLGGYILREKLGSGGMGEVWRADHAFLARPAAVKIIRPEVLYGLNGLDRQAKAKAQLAMGRLEREAKATAQLTSTHTVRVYDFGRGPDTTFFFAMELLDGLDLQSLVARYGPQPQERVKHILLQACDSLCEAHDRGMVHRDIKPANLFLCRMGKTLDHLKVLDFGLVRSDPTSKPDDVDTLPRLTRQGIISGSPSYMSPEQAEGSDHLDRRADIYAPRLCRVLSADGVASISRRQSDARPHAADERAAPTDAASQSTNNDRSRADRCRRANAGQAPRGSIRVG